MNCEYDRALTNRTPETGGSFNRLKESEPNHAIALNQVEARRIVVSHAKFVPREDGSIEMDRIYFLNPEKVHPEYVPVRQPKYLRIDRPTDVQESQEYSRHMQKLRGWQ